jgi:thiamine biosynthesis lipoprotein
MLLFALLACDKKEKESSHIQTFAFNTIIDIQIYDHSSETLESDILDLMTSIEKKMSRYIDSSEISKINQNSGIKSVDISSETYEVIKKTLYYSELTDGVFDITIGPIIDLWKIGTEEEAVPPLTSVEETLPLVDYQKIILEDGSVFLTTEGMSIDLGGVVKGYAADQIVSILKENNVESALINLGGNIYVHGYKADGSQWKVGIRNPFEGRSDYIGTLTTYSQTIVTSGPYEKYFYDNERRYHHIFDPRTGFPTRGDLESVTIISDNSMIADMLTTSVFALGLEEGISLINSLDKVDCILITKEKKVYLSENIQDKFVLNNDQFDIIK